MWKALTIGTILLLVAGLFSATRLRLASPDYVAGGTCTATDIQNTYEALSGLRRGFHLATRHRVNDEWWRQRSHMLNLTTHVEWNLNGWLDESFSKPQTAAYTCNRSTPYLYGLKYPHSVPDNVAMLKPLVTDSSELWRLATCASMRESYAPYAVSLETVDKLRQLCRL